MAVRVAFNLLCIELWSMAAINGCRSKVYTLFTRVTVGGRTGLGEPTIRFDLSTASKRNPRPTVDTKWKNQRPRIYQLQSIYPMGQSCSTTGKSGAGLGHTLVNALESFVVPLIQGDGDVLGLAGLVTDMSTEERLHAKSQPRAASDDESDLTMEARDLLSALKRYIVALVNPLADSEAANLTEDVEKVIDDDFPADTQVNRDAVVVRNPCFSVGSVPFSRAVEEAYTIVFNKMPIHMLMFSSDGTGIRLGDRNEVWRYVSTQIQDEIGRYSHTPDSHFLVWKHTRYAILSHTWLQDAPGEVTYGNWQHKAFKKTSAGYAKVKNFCRIAASEHHLRLGWMDTVCINKESSSELGESIRSMYKWYQAAAVCITYLADTASLDAMHADKWFTRGWTLQELIASNSMRFYAADWKTIHSEGPLILPAEENDKENRAILKQIQRATTISEEELRHPMRVPISRRMQWAVHRRVTREEDLVYSLMGIFDISMSIAYGEGAEHAFRRLVKKILHRSPDNVLDIANWGYSRSDITLFQKHPGAGCTLIPPSLKSYEGRAEAPVMWFRPSTPIILTNIGICLPVLMMPAIPDQFLGQCLPRGKYSATVTITKSRAIRYNILDRRIFERPPAAQRTDCVIFGVLNIQESTGEVTLPTGNCFAVLLEGDLEQMMQPVFQPHRRSKTVLPIVFELTHHWGAGRKIMKGDLRKHGMALHNVYL
ncbi:hypothetical protein HYPSUDRAFT_41581 [Hypholoma sublateritium FD-334 SS-4]|uniref:Heterokaryon incompatibility domain-containing protein n=1 Tax=Hypholoma sublateritium (strain FD-334 SS-4) TaxID=945553 RepID=A0A0D2NSD3_HYPSF|nr:hypothetical protein HYPSUDRAFT_41581 [Hypholoma sublateritium FD-334 SS-4]